MDNDICEALVTGTILRPPQFLAGPGTPRLLFTIQSRIKRTDRATGEEKVSTPWSKVTLWGSMAERFRKGAALELREGDRVFVRGAMHQSNYVGKGGDTHKKTEINAFFIMPGELAAEVE
jgi:single-stranded DNA-binding protein